MFGMKKKRQEPETIDIENVPSPKKQKKTYKKQTGGKSGSSGKDRKALPEQDEDPGKEGTPSVSGERKKKKKKRVLIEFKDVCKKYEQGDNVFYALRDASFTINEGEMVVILGPSGAGKSTLLNLLGGMDSASSGHIWFDGSDLTTFNDNQLTAYRAQNVGVVFQFYNLIPTLTAYENVALMRDIKNGTGDPEEALAAVGLAEHMHQFPSQLSGGEQQRTSIARALAKNPKLLLCDEPTGALDTETGREVLKLLQDMSREKKRTVVMVTHNSFFADIADTVIRVKNGGIKSIGHNDDPKDASEVSW